MKHLLASTAFATVLFASPATLSQEAATVQVAESAEHGSYLTDAEGRALYLFTNDTQASGSTAAQVSCTGDCLVRWPPLYSDGEPVAGEKR